MFQYCASYGLYVWWVSCPPFPLRSSVFHTTSLIVIRSLNQRQISIIDYTSFFTLLLGRTISQSAWLSVLLAQTTVNYRSETSHGNVVVLYSTGSLRSCQGTKTPARAPGHPFLFVFFNHRTAFLKVPRLLSRTV